LFKAQKLLVQNSLELRPTGLCPQGPTCL